MTVSLSLPRLYADNCLSNSLPACVSSCGQFKVPNTIEMCYIKKAILKKQIFYLLTFAFINVDVVISATNFVSISILEERRKICPKVVTKRFAFFRNIILIV